MASWWRVGGTLKSAFKGFFTNCGGLNTQLVRFVNKTYREYSVGFEPLALSKKERISLHTTTINFVIVHHVWETALHILFLFFRSEHIND